MVTTSDMTCPGSSNATGNGGLSVLVRTPLFPPDVTWNNDAPGPDATDVLLIAFLFLIRD